MNPIFATDSWQSFMEAIRANPLDDLPRLVSADWLDETGDKEAADFATFIRLGCEIGEMKAKGRMRCERSFDFADLHEIGRFTKRCRCRPCSMRRREWACLRGHKTWDWTLEAGKPMAMWDDNLRKRTTFPWQLLAANYTGPTEPRPEEIPFPHFFAEFDRGFIARCRPTMAVWMQYGPLAVRGPFACVERVEISDKNPFEDYSTFHKKTLWAWFHVDPEDDLTGDDPNVLNSRMFDRLKFGPRPVDHEMMSRRYKSSEDAITALSTAALKWAWSQTPPE